MTSSVFLSSLILIVDTSALIAVLFREQDWTHFHLTLEGAHHVAMSAASYLELFIVAERRVGQGIWADIDRFLEKIEVEVVPVDVIQAKLARQAFERFGKGRHPAGLNFGDCFSYALAKYRNEPLLYKGDDFSRTDLILA